MSERPDPQPESDHWDGHGFDLECCPWRTEETGIVRKAVAYGREPSIQGARAFGVLKKFVGLTLPGAPVLASGERFVLGAYSKGTIVRFHADTTSKDHATAESYIYLGLLDQFKNKDGSYADTILYFEESDLKGSKSYVASRGAKATWCQVFTVGNVQHDRFLLPSGKREYIYRMNRVEILMEGSKEHSRQSIRSGLLSRLLPSRMPNFSM